MSNRENTWISGEPFVVTDDDMSLPWSGYRDGRKFRCHLCGAFFKPGDIARFVWCNGVKEARDAGVHCGNVMVCAACDGTKDGRTIYERLAEHERTGKMLHWSLIDPERLPPSPHRKRR